MNDVFPGLVRATAAYPDIVVGLGARGGASTAEILDLIDTVLAEHRLDRSDVVACVTVDARRFHPALREAAASLGVPLLDCPLAEMTAQVPNPSTTVRQHLGIASVAEAAALTLGPLIAEKHRSPNATCALSRCQIPLVIASTAPSTLATSSAGR